jgi:putative DNA primase/helicase
MITKLAPVEYDPDAEAPLWTAFLDKVLDRSESLIRCVQRITGYSLTGNTSEQCFFILYGTGANGKTTLVETLRAMLGEYAMQTRVETLMVKRNATIPEDIARLKGARLVTASEAEEGHRLAESLVKQLTGGDRLTARFLYSRSFEYAPEFALWLETNHKPTIYGTDRAIWRRIRLVPFTVAIPEDEQDRELGRKLKAELPGILTWAVQGCLEWQREGLGVPEEVRAATQSYRAEMDKLGRFFDDCCVIDKLAEVGASDLYRAYDDWCTANGEKSVSGTRFGRQMAERGFEKGRGKQGRTVYYGVGLLVHNGEGKS